MQFFYFKYFSAITSHNRLDTSHRAATSVHQCRINKFGGFYERNWGGVEYKQTIKKQSVITLLFIYGLI